MKKVPGRAGAGWGKIAAAVLIAAFIIYPSILCGQVRHIKVATLNVWSGLDYKGVFKIGEYEKPGQKELRFNALLKEARRLNPDIIFLQEVNPASGFASRLADSLSCDEIHQVSNAGIKFLNMGIPLNLMEGGAILAKKELGLEKYEAFKLSGGAGIYSDLLTVHFNETAFVLTGKIILNNTPVYLLNIHLRDALPADSLLNLYLDKFVKQYSNDKRELEEILEVSVSQNEIKKDEYRELEKYIRSLSEKGRVIAAGDFNAQPDERELKTFIRNCELRDCYNDSLNGRGYTWDYPGNPNTVYSVKLKNAAGEMLKGADIIHAYKDSVARRVDYIFADKSFGNEDILNSGVVFNHSHSGVYPSDHYGVISEIVFRNNNASAEEMNSFHPLKENAIEGLPVVSYDTDAGFGYGAKAFFLNQLGISESFDLMLFNSTKGERWYRMVFSVPDFEQRQGKVYPYSFDLIIDYDKWIKTSYFGTGSSSRYDNEKFYSKEPLDISLIASRGFTPVLVAQAGIKYRSVRNFNFSAPGMFDSLFSPLSSGTARMSSLLFNIRYDSRNSYLDPDRGVVLQAELETAFKSFLSNTSFTRIGLLIQDYTLLFYPGVVLASRLYVQSVYGSSLPLQVYLPLGGNATLRGYQQDRFLDKTSALFNSELRFPLYKRLQAVAGIDCGKVWSSPDKMDLKDWKTAPAAGLRFDMDNFIIRLDFGFSSETVGFSFNFNHLY